MLGWIFFHSPCKGVFDRKFTLQVYPATRVFMAKNSPSKFTLPQGCLWPNIHPQSSPCKAVSGRIFTLEVHPARVFIGKNSPSKFILACSASFELKCANLRSLQLTLSVSEALLWKSWSSRLFPSVLGRKKAFKSCVYVAKGNDGHFDVS